MPQHALIILKSQFFFLAQLHHDNPLQISVLPKTGQFVLQNLKNTRSIQFHSSVQRTAFFSPEGTQQRAPSVRYTSVRSYSYTGPLFENLYTRILKTSGRCLFEIYEWCNRKLGFWRFNQNPCTQQQWKPMTARSQSVSSLTELPGTN